MVARKALLNHLRNVDPPLSEQEITRERLALEEAVRKVEAEAAAAARWKREEEARRKAEEERQAHVIRARLAEAASPAPSLTPDSRLDDTPDNLPELPLRQRALIKTPRQIPAQVKVSLNNYDGLEKSTGDARRVFREALLANLRSVEPALAEPDIDEKGGKQHMMPCHYALAEALRAYIDAAGIGADKKGFMFRTSRGHGGTALADQPMAQTDAWRMVRKHALAAGIGAPIGNHSFRATGITAYLANGGALEHAQAMAAHHQALRQDEGTAYPR
jgi:integrase